MLLNVRGGDANFTHVTKITKKFDFTIIRKNARVLSFVSKSVKMK